MPLFLIASSSSARLPGDTRWAIGGTLGEKPSRAITDMRAVGFLSSTMVSTTSSCELSIAWSNLAVRH